MFEASLVAILYIHLRRYEISHEVMEMEVEVEVGIVEICITTVNFSYNE